MAGRDAHQKFCVSFVRTIGYFLTVFQYIIGWSVDLAGFSKTSWIHHWFDNFFLCQKRSPLKI